MFLPVTDSALIGTCLAASALGLVVLTSSGGGGTAPQDPAPVMSTQTAPAGTSTSVTIPQTEPDIAPEVTLVDDAFGRQVRDYLLANPEVIFEAVAVYERRNAQAQAGMDSALIAANAEALFDDPNSWVGGNPDGDVTFVEFIDYRCGFCKRAHPEVNQMLELDGGVRLIVKEFPILGSESELASRFAIAVLQLEGDAAYGAIHHALITHDPAITAAVIADMAEAEGLDFDAISAHMNSDDVTAVIEDNRALAQRLQITGTPTYVIETEMMRGYLTADALLDVVESVRQ